MLMETGISFSSTQFEKINSYSSSKYFFFFFFFFLGGGCKLIYVVEDASYPESYQNTVILFIPDNVFLSAQIRYMYNVFL